LNARHIDILLPVKDLSAAKSRLETSPSQRRAATLSYLAHVVTVGLKSSQRLHCWIVSPQDLRPELNLDAHLTGPRLHWIEEIEPQGLNQALEFARSQVRRHRGSTGSTIGVVLPDLPWLTSEELLGLCSLQEQLEESSVQSLTLACDRHGRGTNALLTNTDTEFCYRFGPDSFLKHLAQAWARQIEVRVFRSTGTACDVDVPADLVALG
jgi:2-phospho-L-lactate/phosphoenolpyruvate guanylyltransferase